MLPRKWSSFSQNNTLIVKRSGGYYEIMERPNLVHGSEVTELIQVRQQERSKNS